MIFSEIVEIVKVLSVRQTGTFRSLFSKPLTKSSRSTMFLLLLYQPFQSVLFAYVVLCSVIFQYLSKSCRFIISRIMKAIHPFISSLKGAHPCSLNNFRNMVHSIHFRNTFQFHLSVSRKQVDKSGKSYFLSMIYFQHW